MLVRDLIECKDRSSQLTTPPHAAASPSNAVRKVPGHVVFSGRPETRFPLLMWVSGWLQGESKTLPLNCTCCCCRLQVQIKSTAGIDGHQVMMVLSSPLGGRSGLRTLEPWALVWDHDGLSVEDTVAFRWPHPWLFSCLCFHQGY